MLNDIDDIQEISPVYFHYSRELLIFTFIKLFKPNLSKRLKMNKLKSWIDDIVYTYILTKSNTVVYEGDKRNLPQHN